MRIGWTAGGKTVDATCSAQCHQLSQRSVFSFGPRRTYSLDQIQAVAGPNE